MQHANGSDRQPPLGNAPESRPCRLALSDGTLLRGEAFGAVGQRVVVEAEVVFNTALTGYQESLSDPSYLGQILVQTTPMIGNTGANDADVESGRAQVSGLVVHELASRHSNYRAAQSLSAYLRASGVLGLAGIDTRALTRKLRSHGVMSGAMTDDGSISDAELLDRARGASSMEGADLASLAARADQTTWHEGLGRWGVGRWGTSVADCPRTRRVLALDCGGKRTIYRQLADRGCKVVVSPPNISGEEIARLYAEEEIDGVFISNGPGDPAAVGGTIEALRFVLNDPRCERLPIFGICLGHQLLAAASGAETYKLAFGHRGANQPVVHAETGRVAITSQNHGFAVRAESLPAGCVATHLHLNDGTLAGFRFRDRPVFSVQYHPEASPGPHDAVSLFDAFVASLDR